MKQLEAETLARVERIDRAVITNSPDGWKVFLYGEHGAHDFAVETARGGHRTWASIDTAYSWIRALPGAAIPVTVD